MHIINLLMHQQQLQWSQQYGALLTDSLSLQFIKENIKGFTCNTPQWLFQVTWVGYMFHLKALLSIVYGC